MEPETENLIRPQADLTRNISLNKYSNHPIMVSCLSSELFSKSSWWFCFCISLLSVSALVLGENNLQNQKNLPKRIHRSPQNGEQSLEFDFTSEFSGEPYNSFGGSGSQAQNARQVMVENQEKATKGMPNVPLYKQSYPGLYSHGQLKKFEYEPTMRVSHGYSHHGKEGHLFLLHPDTSHLFRGVAHAINLDSLI